MIRRGYASFDKNSLILTNIFTFYGKWWKTVTFLGIIGNNNEKGKGLGKYEEKREEESDV